MAILFGWCFRKLTSSSFTRKLVSELNIPEKTCWQQFASIYPLSSSISYITLYYFNRNEDIPAKFVLFSDAGFESVQQI